MRRSPDGPRRGAYGLHLAGDRDLVGLLDAVPRDWPTWTISTRVDPGVTEPGVEVRRNRARAEMQGEGAIELNRDSCRITFVTRRELSDAALVHPMLARAASIAAYWAGRSTLHASGVVMAGRAWGLLGQRHSGKSTTAALLVSAGAVLLCDDCLIFDGRRAFAGPPAIDLRREAAALLGGQPLGRVGTRERFRLAAPAARHEADLAGLISLTWDECVALEPVPPAERVGLLAPHLPFPVGADELLRLVDIPMLSFARPHDLAQAERGIDHLLGALDEATSRPVPR